MLRYRIRSCFDLFAASTGLLKLYEVHARRGLTILMYHRILPLNQCLSYPLDALVIPSEVYSEQVRWLAAHCHVLPVREALAVLNSGKKKYKPLVSLSFDDGYADNYEVAAPVLESVGLRGTFFITTDFVEKGEPLWYDRAAEAWQRVSVSHQKDLMAQLNEGFEHSNGKKVLGIQSWMERLKKTSPSERFKLMAKAESMADGEMRKDLYRPMSRNHVTELSNKGHEVGSHTVNHCILPQLGDDQLADELERSAKILGQWTGNAVTGFCYPNGDFDARVERAVQKAGYDYACTTQTGLNHRGDPPAKLLRRPITLQRTTNAKQGHDAIGFRGELCGFREVWRTRP